MAVFPRYGPRRAALKAALRPHEPARSGVIDCAVYRNGKRETADVTYAAALAAVRDDPDAYVWLGLHEPAEDELTGIAAAFGLHPLAVEDAVHAHQRPKLERYGDTIVTTFKTVRYVEHETLTSTCEVVTTGEIMVFLGRNFVISVRHGQHSGLAQLRSRLEEHPELLGKGPSVVLYAIADHVVDDYLAVTAEIQVDVDQVEFEVFGASSSGSDSGRAYQLKREVLEFKRAVAPLAGPLRELSESTMDLVHPKTREYFRDVFDHQQRVAEQVLSIDELLTSFLQANLARVTVAQNEDMRKISAWVAIAAVPTALAGIEGMNFDHMPELRQPWGYPALLLVMLTACVLLYRGFKRNGWL